jgi:DNA ligase-associated metallophosphoesterase
MSPAALRQTGHTPDAGDGALIVELCGLEAVLRLSGALWLPSQRALIAGDLHLEKGSAYASRGQLLPPYDTTETLTRLGAEVLSLNPATLVLLGDSFHDRRALGRLGDANRAAIKALGQHRSLIWITGNHDDEGLGAAFAGGETLPGDLAADLALGHLTLRHEPQPGPAPGDVAGHLHPCAKIARAGRSVWRRCFLTDGERLILPAFGSYAGGLNVCDPAFAGMFAGEATAVTLGHRRVYPLPVVALC